MSHEIRTPMGAMIGMTGMLLDSPLSPEQREYATVIGHSGDALLAIINDILDFSKLEADKLALEEIDFDLYTTLEECAETVAAIAHKKNLEIILPARPGGPGSVRGDQGRLRQIVLNLLSNAVKFTAAGEIVITASLTPYDDKNQVARIKVRDTGIGIPAAVQSRLFEAFVQADSSTTRCFGGTGLGLAISKRLVELMNGEIGIVSEVGQGSTFWFTVRVGVAQVKDIVAPQSGRKLLVVDDNETNGLVLQLQLQNLGYFSRVAKNAEEALKLLSQPSEGPPPFDGVLSDLRMPHMDGLALAAAVRGIPRITNLPFVLLTTHEDRARTNELGIDEVLSKPVRESQLARSLSRIFSQNVVVSGTEKAEQNSGSPPQLSKVRVLVAEDSLANQKYIGLILRKLGYEVDVVSNGLEALDAFHAGSYHVVLMDCQMPEMDGFAATRAIRASGSPAAGIPIIALTANALRSDKDQCLAAGMSDYVSKPFKVDDLHQKLQEWSLKYRAEPASPPTDTKAPQKLQEKQRAA